MNSMISKQQENTCMDAHGSIRIPDAILICNLDNDMRPDRIVYANKAASQLSGYALDKLTILSFENLCSSAINIETSLKTTSIQFTAPLITKDNKKIECHFKTEILSDTDTYQMYLLIRPVDDTIPITNQTADSFTINNKFKVIEKCSSGVSHDINNAVNLITLSLDLLDEIITEMLQIIQKQGDSVLIRSMPYDELVKSVAYLTSNLSDSSLKISTTAQTLFQFLRSTGREQPSQAYDIRKVIQSAITLTICEIKKTSSDFHFEAPQGILKRTGDQRHIQQALLNCILFICNNSPDCTHSFAISTDIKPQRGEFCIMLTHSGCTTLPHDCIAALHDSNSAVRTRFVDHPLFVAQALITLNGGSISVTSGKPSGIEITITLSTVCNIY